VNFAQELAQPADVSAFIDQVVWSPPIPAAEDARADVIGAAPLHATR
jgi:hypothetical protein